MTISKTITIQGCGHERPATWTFVDLAEPEKIGQHPIRKTQICPETPLKERVILETEVTGKTISDEKHREHAEVIISCHARNCPHHELYKATS
ncbi:MAG: hypothetical protein Q8Q30_00780 [Candidatus Woesebacteria bacterium]|nr:hypothetical protein [Candidatus Woesebacteria bacterium]